MTTAAPRVLFISHDAGRTGAPRALLDIIAWLARQGIGGVAVLANDGPLRPAFEALVPTLLAPTHPPDGRGRPLRDRFDRLRWRRQVAAWPQTIQECHGPFDVVYSNTCTNGRVLRILRPLCAPVLTHAHEMGFWIDHMLGESQFKEGARLTSRWIAASQAVASSLTSRGVDPTTIDIVFEPSGTRDPARPAVSLREEAGLQPDAAVVIGAGTLDWRKGPDLFLQVAREVTAANPKPPHFIWLGTGSPLDVAKARHDAERSGLSEHVTLLGERTDAAPYISQADLFILTSREDSYPIVMLEAGRSAVPTVAFAGSGGAEEFVTAGGGVLVPYLDTTAMARAVVDLLRDANERARVGALAQVIVAELSDPDVVGRAVLDIILKTIS